MDAARARCPELCMETGISPPQPFTVPQVARHARSGHGNPTRPEAPPRGPCVHSGARTRTQPVRSRRAALRWLLPAFALWSTWAWAASPQETALTRLAAATANELSRQKVEPPVALHVRAASPELARAFTTLLAAQLSRAKLSPQALDAPSADAAEGLARDAGARSLVRLTLALEQGALTARGDLLGTWVNFWSGAARTRPPAPAAALLSSVEADAQALALLSAPLVGPAPPGELKLALATFAKLPLPSAALAAGDLDGDGKDEVVVLTDEEVIALSSTGAVLARREHRALPASPTPCREPFGAVAVLGGRPGKVAYASGRRAKGELLAFDRQGFRPTAQTDDAVLARHRDAQLTGKLLAGLNLFAPEVTLTGAPPSAAPAPFTTASVFQGAAGPEQLYVFPDGGGRWLRERAALSLQGLGAGSALVDLDGDGRAEVATSAPQFSPEPDALRVLSGAEGPARWEQPVPRGRVLQLAGADLDGDGKQELVLGVWLPDGTGELIVARRISP